MSGPINCSPSELCTFLRALAAEYSPTSSSGTGQSAPSRFARSVKRSSRRAKRTVACLGSPSTPTYGSSPESLGEASWTSSAGASRASPSATPPEGEPTPSTFGPRCIGSSQNPSPNGSLPKMSQTLPSGRRPTISTHLVTRRGIAVSTPPIWVRHIVDRDGGLLPTPTATVNHECQSMSKWPAYRAFQDWLGGQRIAPALWEWMMGFPVGWSDSRPLETDRFRSWQLGLGSFLETTLAAALAEEREDVAVFDWAMGGSDP